MALFKIGDTVQLKSGGSVMTVNQIYDETSTGMLSAVYRQCKMAYPDATVFYGCTWFKGRDLHNASFREEMLKLAE